MMLVFMAVAALVLLLASALLAAMLDLPRVFYVTFAGAVVSIVFLPLLIESAL